MIKALQLQNFQSHPKTKLVFDPGVNVIVGSSDSGKSATIRALNWVVTNRPAGDAFRSSWGGDTEVTIMLDDATVISRKKTDKANEYAVNDQVFKAFSQDVPEEVATAINFNDLNTQYQMDPPFLLSSSSGDVARILNKVARLDDIDRVLSNIESRKRSTRSEITSSERQLKEEQEALAAFGDLDQLGTKLESLERVCAEIDTAENDKIKITGLLASTQRIQHMLDTYPDTRALEKKLSELENISIIISEQEQRRDDIESALVNAAHAQDRLEEIAAIASYETTCDEVMALTREIRDLEQRRRTISDLTLDIAERRRQLEETESDLHDYEEKFHVAMPDVCPLCGRGGEI